MDIAGKTLITPSRPSYWNGTPVEGSPLTREQQVKATAMRGKLAANQRRYGLPETFRYRVRAEPKAGQYVGDMLEFECPVMGCTKDRTRLNVIAPNGMETWVPWK